MEVLSYVLTATLFAACSLGAVLLRIFQCLIFQIGASHFSTEEVNIFPSHLPMLSPQLYDSK